MSNISNSDLANSTSSESANQGQGSSLPLDRLVRISLKSVILWTTYLASVFALVVAYNRFGSDLGITSHLAILALGGGPLFVTVVTHSIPTWWDNRRKRRVEDYGKYGELAKPKYFRLTPYLRDDRSDFKRADLAHEAVFNWIASNTSPVLFLSGASGTGKSSLLNAYVLPTLEAGDPGFVTLIVRTFNDPANALAEALKRPGAIWKNRAPETASLRELLEKACTYLDGKSLLVVLDQFEEFLILHDDEAQRDLKTLLASLTQDPIPNLTVLLSLRSEYLGQLDDGSLPPIEKGRTWLEIAPFNLRVSQKFLDDSGLQIEESLRYQVLTEATTVEGTEGLIRPITLNMFGVILDRFSGRLPRDVEPGMLLTNYVRRALDNREIKDEASDMLRHMVTNRGRREPQSEDALVEATGQKREFIRGALLSLANQGIVRRIDATKRIWEVSHDFLADMLAQLLYKIGKPTAKPQSLNWIAPSIVLIWFVAFWAISPFYLEWRHRGAVQSLGISNVRLDLKEEEYSAYFPQEAADPLLNSAVLLLNELKYPVVEVSLSGAIKLHSATPLAQLKRLRILNLNETLVTDLGSLKSLTRLQTLYLSATEVSDLTPLKGLTSLQALYLSSTKVSDLAPLKDLTSLQTLRLSSTKVSDLAPLKDLTSLQTLYLSRTKVSDLMPLKGLTGLRTLQLTSTRVSDLAPLKGLASLRTLHLTGTDVSDLAPLTGLASLRTLNLWGTSISDLAPLKSLTNLQSLDLEGTKVSDLAPLKGLTSLQSLDLYDTRVSDLAPLKSLTGLKKLRLHKTASSVSEIESLRDALPNLNFLH